VLSPFSDYAFEPGNYDFDPRETTNLAMKNQKNSVAVTLDTGSKHVVGIEVYAKESNSPNLYLVDFIDKVRDDIDNDISYSISFKNNKVLRVASETLFNRVYDNVPIKAETQEVIGNRLLYANYEENYDLKDSKGRNIDIQLDLDSVQSSLDTKCSQTEYRISLAPSHDSSETISYTRCGETSATELTVVPGDDFIICAGARPTVTDPSSNPSTKIHNATEDQAEFNGASTSLSSCNVVKGTKSLKTNSTYDVGIVYYDKYGRKSTVLPSFNNAVSIGDTSYYKHQLRVRVNNLPPVWADRFKFAVKQNFADYDVIISNGPVYQSTEDRRYYVKLRGREIDKVKAGDIVRVKHEYSGTSVDKKLNVKDVKFYKADEIADDTNIPNNTQNLDSGTYMILEDGFLSAGPYDTSSNNLLSSRSAFYVFETVKKRSVDTVFYEVPGTYDITDGFHTGSEQDQTADQPAEIILDAYNVFSFGNGVESYKIADEIQGDTFDAGVRVNEVLDDYRVNKRVASITYSDVFDPTTNYNGLNVFDLALLNYKDLDEANGKIKKILSRDNNIISFQENKIFNIMFNKNVLFTASGSGDVSQSLNVLGQEIPYSGEYGIPFSPTSVQRWGGRVYLSDERRGAVLRLSQDGLTEISDYGMRDWFADNLSPNDSKFVLSESYTMFAECTRLDFENFNTFVSVGLVSAIT
jgi:hypothetical protein